MRAAHVAPTTRAFAFLHYVGDCVRTLVTRFSSGMARGPLAHTVRRAAVRKRKRGSGAHTRSYYQLPE